MKPVYDCVKKYAKRRSVRFHMPAHGGRKIGYLCSKYDLTELSCTDNLLSPQTEIKLAQKLLSEAYNSEKSYFVTSGTSTSLLIMLNSVRNLGDSVVIERNCHKSVWNALAVLNIRPVVLPCEMENGLVQKPSIESIEKCLRENPDSIGVLITTPDYFGRITDLREIKKLLSKESKLLLVDNAHGAHFPFFSMLSKTVGENADIYVSSPHKTMPVLTGGSCLHVNNKKLIEAAEVSINMIHSTSPSYPVMASLDFARELFAEKKSFLRRIADTVCEFKQRAGDIGITFLDNDDILKVVMSFTKLGIEPEKVADFLEKNNIFVEFANDRFIVLIVSVFAKKSDFRKLFNVLRDAVFSLPKDYEPDKISEYSDIASNNKEILPYLSAISANKELIPLDRAVNRVCAVNAGLYPPAFPLVVAGEIYTEKSVEILKKAGKHAFCVAENRVYVVK